MTEAETIRATVIGTLLASMVIGAVAVALPPLSRLLVIAWTWLVSWPWPDEVRERRLEEARSHCYEHFHDPAEAGRSALALAVILIIQVVAGMAGDLVWGLEGLQQRRGNLKRRRDGTQFRLTRVSPDTQILLRKTTQGQVEAYALDNEFQIKRFVEPEAGLDRRQKRKKKKRSRKPS